MKPTSRVLAAFLLAAPLAVPAAAIAPPWTPLGPFGGPVQTLAADPRHPGTVYAVLPAGIFKATDSGASWTRLSLDAVITSLAIDPVHPATLYVGSPAPELLRKSTDGGASWSFSSLGLPVGTHSERPVSLTVDPSDPRRLLLVYLGTIWRSTDAGASWRAAATGLPPASESPARTVAFAARPAGTAFAATSAGLFRTSDSGLSWKRLDHGLPPSEVGLLALAPSDPRALYVVLNGLGLYRTADGGDSWRHVAGPSNLFGALLSVSPQSPFTLYASASGSGPLFRSTNGGTRWSPLSGVSAVTALAFDPATPQRIYAGVTSPPLGGVLRSDDGGASWARRSQGMTGLETNWLALDPGEPGRLWATVGAALFRGVDGGTRWVQATPPFQGYLGGPLAVGDSSALLAAVPVQTPHGPLTYAIRTMADGGASWKTVLTVRSFDVSRIRAAPSRPSTIYAAWGSLASGPFRLYRSTDDGETWELRSEDGAPLPFYGPYDLAVSPSSADVVYLSGAHYDASASRYERILIRSDDGGSTWAPADAGLAAGGLVQLAVDPQDADLVYAGTDDGVWKSTDGGRSWSRAGLAGQNVLILIAPAVPGRLYTVLDGRVLRSDDAGATWRGWSRGLKVSFVFSLVADPGDPRRLYATTSNGVWALSETD